MSDSDSLGDVPAASTRTPRHEKTHVRGPLSGPEKADLRKLKIFEKEGVVIAAPRRQTFLCHSTDARLLPLTFDPEVGINTLFNLDGGGR